VTRFLRLVAIWYAAGTVLPGFAMWLGYAF